jgi:hypothetical protein
MNLFADDVLPNSWDGELGLSTIVGRVDWRRTTTELPCGNGVVEIGFVFNGASAGIFRKMAILNFPKWKHPISTCRHDKRCSIANNQLSLSQMYPYLSEKARAYRKEYRRLRKIADAKFFKDVGVGGTWWEQAKGWLAVSLGAVWATTPFAKEEEYEELASS